MLMQVMIYKPEVKEDQGFIIGKCNMLSKNFNYMGLRKKKNNCDNLYYLHAMMD